MQTKYGNSWAVADPVNWNIDFYGDVSENIMLNGQTSSSYYYGDIVIDNYRGNFKGNTGTLTNHAFGLDSDNLYLAEYKTLKTTTISVGAYVEAHGWYGAIINDVSPQNSNTTVTKLTDASNPWCGTLVGALLFHTGRKTSDGSNYINEVTIKDINGTGPDVVVYANKGRTFELAGTSHWYNYQSGKKDGYGQDWAEFADSGSAHIASTRGDLHTVSKAAASYAISTVKDTYEAPCFVIGKSSLNPDVATVLTTCFDDPTQYEAIKVTNATANKTAHTCMSLGNYSQWHSSNARQELYGMSELLRYSNNDGKTTSRGGETLYVPVLKKTVKKLEDIYNEYIYKNYNIKVPVNSPVFPLFEHNVNKTGKTQFTFKTPGIGGSLSLICYETAGSSPVVKQYSLNSGAVTSAATTVSANTTYTIDCVIDGQGLYCIKYTPSSYSAVGSYSFSSLPDNIVLTLDS